ncbi:DUF4350 domain-containing protein [Pedobacter sp. BS3]|uniref:DUF4350 domain-containing protein n=1 Tax=Pedobacter sp. BS3 TaxID=2567937 RepID=UPI001F5B7911|nr:DUF4350 domain-containing protein [Pedobacter sp. BS3]
MAFKSAVLLLALTCIGSAQAQVVTLDYFFNHETRKSKTGEMVQYHYTWEDKTNTGYSVWGDIFKQNGAQLKSLSEAPAAANLKGTDIYIIPDPDTKKESPSPNYIEPAHIKAISQWVKAGGVLVMLANDSANVELQHFNNLAAAFGMHFNTDLQNHVIDDNHFEDGAIVTTGNPVFKTAKKIFMKDVCSISVQRPAQAVLKNKQGAIVIASANVGKGKVVAVSDPWIYNEYCNGRLPAQYENYKGAEDFSKWLIGLAKK